MANKPAQPGHPSRTRDSAAKIVALSDRNPLGSDNFVSLAAHQCGASAAKDVPYETHIDLHRPFLYCHCSNYHTDFIIRAFTLFHLILTFYMHYFQEGTFRHIANEEPFDMVHPYTTSAFFRGKDKHRERMIAIEFRKIGGEKSIVLEMTHNEAVELRNRLNDLIIQK